MALALGRLAFSLAFLLAGVYVFGAAWRSIVRRAALVARGIVVEGRVVAFESRASSSGSATYRKYVAPVIEFITTAGAPVRVTASSARPKSPYALGDRVAMRYLAEDAKNADIDADATRWLPIVVLLVLGVVAVTCGVLPWVLRA